MSADAEALRLQAALMREAEEKRIGLADLLDHPCEPGESDIARLEARIDALDGSA